MSALGIVAIIVIVVLLAVVAALVVQRRRSERLQRRFGPEYRRTVEEAGSRREAEAALASRERRRAHLDIRPLPPEARDRYDASWTAVQAGFVDAPAEAVARADALVHDVMRDRGYPMDDFEHRAADISVDHADVVDDYRAAHGISERSARGEAATEDLRQAMVHYRSLFERLLLPDATPSPR